MQRDAGIHLEPIAMVIASDVLTLVQAVSPFAEKAGTGSDACTHATDHLRSER